MFHLSNIWTIFSLLFPFMFSINSGNGSEEFEEAKGLKTLTSKKALSFLEPQKPSAAISKRAPSVQTDDVGKLSPKRGFKTGSVQML